MTTSTIPLTILTQSKHTVFALVFSTLMLSGCAGGRSKFPGTEEGARSLLSEFLKPGADCEALSSSLRPSTGDYRKIFEQPFADLLERNSSPAWASGKMVIAPNRGQSELLLQSVPSTDIRSWTERADMILPGGYRSLTNDIKSGFTVYTFKFVQRGADTGTAYDGLVFVNGHWRIFPKPWRARKG